MTVHRLRFGAFHICAIGILMITLFVRREESGKRDTLFGILKESEVLRRSETICEVIAPQVRNRHLIADRRTTAVRDNVVERSWLVDCTDMDGDDLVHIDWDAISGRITWIGVSPTSYSTGGSDPIVREVAASRARFWMLRTGIGSYAPQWRLSSVAKPISGNWRVQWRSHDSIAIVSLRENGGALSYISVHRLEEAPRHSSGVRPVDDVPRIRPHNRTHEDVRAP